MAALLGHTIEPPVPSLFTFNVEDSGLRALAGIAVPDAEVEAPVAKLKQSGPLLITHWGLSGPAVLKLSAWGARVLAGLDYQFELKVRWLGLKPEEMVGRFERMRKEHPARSIIGGGVVEVPGRLWGWWCARAGLSADLPWARLSRVQESSLREQILSARFPVSGKSTFKDEFVTCGGVRLSEVNFKTMESKVCPGLYLAGEVLDIDAVTGGFNFQAAWTTGWLAGRAMTG